MKVFMIVGLCFLFCLTATGWDRPDYDSVIQETEQMLESHRQQQETEDFNRDIRNSLNTIENDRQTSSSITEDNDWWD